MTLNKISITYNTHTTKKKSIYKIITYYTFINANMKIEKKKLKLKILKNKAAKKL